MYQHHLFFLITRSSLIPTKLHYMDGFLWLVQKILFSLFIIFIDNSMDSLGSFTTCPYRSSLLVTPQGIIQCLHRSDECTFLLVFPRWCVLVWANQQKFIFICSVGGRRLWVRLYFPAGPSMSWIVCKMEQVAVQPLFCRLLLQEFV